MSDRFWSNSEDHPTGSVLLLHLESELDAREAAQIRQHLANCWQCRVRSEEMEKGIHTYVVARRDVLIPRLPPPPSSSHKFTARLYAETGAGPDFSIFRRLLVWLHQVAAPRNVAWLTGACSALTVVGIFAIYVFNPPTMTAAAFFERVHRASGSDKRALHAIGIAKVELRQGNRAIERVVVHGPVPHGEFQQAATPDPTWALSLAPANLDWNDPLSADRFEAWHSLQFGARDRITQTSETVTLTTSLPSMRDRADGPLLVASLTLRGTDWHPIAERFEFSDRAPLEIREVSYEIRIESSAPELPRTVAGDQPAPPKALLVTQPVLLQPDQADLERSEISVREAFHRLEADRNEVPEIAQTDDVIVIRATAATTERQQKLLAAIGGIPYLKLEIRSAENPSGATTTVGTGPVQTEFPSALYSTTPPLAKALWDYKGGMDVANNYLDMVRTSYYRATASANALDRLAQRYPERDWNQLPHDVQLRVNLLAADYIQAIQDRLPDYLRQLSDPLDEMLRQNKVPDSSAAFGKASAGCGSWQSLASGITADLQQGQTSFRRLFVVDQSDTPVDLFVNSLLSEVAQIRARLTQEAKALCTPQL